METNVSENRNAELDQPTVSAPLPSPPQQAPPQNDTSPPESGKPECPPHEPGRERPTPHMYNQGNHGPTVGRDVQTVIQNFYDKLGSEGSEPDRRKPLADFTTELPPHRPLEFALDEDSVEEYFYKFRAERLVLLSCANDHLAFACAQALATKLEIETPANRRLLNFKRLGQEKGEPSIYSIRDINEQADEIVIVVDAVGDLAQNFLDHVLYTRDSGSDSLRMALSAAKTSIICIANREDVSARLASDEWGELYEEECPFPYWNIPFLKPLLRRHFPADYEELESLIMAARARWDRDERKFRLRLESLIKSGKLRDFLTGISLEDSNSVPETLFIGDGRVRDYVLYCGAFFQRLNPREFQRVVSFLLKDKTTTVTVPSTNRKEDGSIEKIEVEEERELVDIWRKSMDKLQRECHLITCLTDDSQTTIDFQDDIIRQNLTELIKLEFAFFHTSQFDHVHNLGLLFDSSAAIADSMLELTAEMINQDPEYYGHDWLLKIFSVLEHSPENLAPHSLFEAISSTDPEQTRQLIYRRTTQLLRKLIEQHQANSFVSELMERLFQRSLFLTAFRLTKGLHSVSDFDEFYWLKQLIDRGTEPVKILVHLYLRGQLKNAGPRVYVLLNGLNSWIKTDPQSESYSQSSLQALQLIFVFCSSIQFDAARIAPHYLFVFADREAAERDLEILVRHLFHPWMEKALEEFELEVPHSVMIGIFIAEWVVTILGNTQGSITSLKGKCDGSPLGPADTVAVLIEQLIKYSTLERQQELIEFWLCHSDVMLARVMNLSYDSEERDELVLRRNRLDDLLTQFRRFAIKQIS